MIKEYVLYIIIDTIRKGESQMNDFGLIGLGVMGCSLALNIEDKGYNVSVYNYTPQRTKDFMANGGKDRNFTDFYDMGEFAKSLKKPRKIMLMTKPGKPVDNMIQGLLPYLDKGDLIIDGGNTHFPDTARRIEELKEKGILFLGVGVSGGEEGALNGPSIMPGGAKEAYDLVEDLLMKISAKTEDGHCCSYMGEGAAGHFIKMLHNGIEYGMMQSIAEAYDIMRKALKLSTDEMADVFEKWNGGELNSYLMEITYKILRHEDEETKEPLIDMILDKAGQKGTGKWTVETALDLGIPTPSLNGAVESRQMSFFKEDRTNLSKKIEKYLPAEFEEKDKLISELENALLFTNFILFSQGIWLMAEASKEYGFNIDISEVLRIWKGGCIIRAKMLDFFREIIKDDKENINLLNSEKALSFLMEKIDSVKYVTGLAKDYYIPTIGFHTALDYFFSMIEENHPANLIQAQRDFFGAHTYNRTDREGIFHTSWD